MLKHTRLARTIQDVEQILSRKINLFEIKDTEDKPKDYLLGIDGRGGAKLGLVPFKEVHCNGGMTIFSLQLYYYECNRRIARMISKSKICSPWMFTI